MRTLVLFDVHGNLAALDAVLAEAQREGFDRVVFGGDAAVLGDDPAGAVDRLRELVPDGLAVQGNTDRYLVAGEEADWLDWTREALGADRLAWLADLPTSVELPEHDALVVHATPRSDEERLLPETPEAEAADALAGVVARRVLGGHVHVQYHRSVRRWELVNPGSVGFPFDGDPRAAWALLDGDRVELRHTDYDRDAVMARLRASGNPAAELSVRRLGTGRA